MQGKGRYSAKLHTDLSKCESAKFRKRERERAEVESHLKVTAMTRTRDVLCQRKCLKHPEVFPVSQPSLITHNAVTFVFKGHEKLNSFHTSINFVEDFTCPND